MAVTYTDDIWNLLHILSLNVIPDMNKIQMTEQDKIKKDIPKMLNLFNLFVNELHTIYSSLPFPIVPVITSCTTQIHVFQWIYNVRKNIMTTIPSLEELSIYYQAPNKIESPSALITKDVWGAYTWRFIHTFTLHTTRLDKVSNLFSILFSILPCSICREHATHYLSDNPIPVESNRDAFKWSIHFHNQVTLRTNNTYGNRKRVYTVEEAILMY
jgi:hypothetical protein